MVPMRVAFALEDATAAALRQFAIGAHQFAHERLDWRVLRAGNSAILGWDQALQSRADGILGVLEPERRIQPQDVGQAKVVILNTATADHAFDTVNSDDVAMGWAVADHLLGCRLEHFGFIGVGSRHFSSQRQIGFEQGLAAAGWACHVPRIEVIEAKRNSPAFGRWLRALRLPCGVMAANDGIGMELIHAVLRRGLRIPEDIAVVGVSDDEMGCLESLVTLSSVHEDYAQVGYRAAMHLDRLMRSLPVASHHVTIPPGEIVKRESSMVYHASDPLVQRALLVINQEVGGPLTVDDLCESLGKTSRRLLEMRFRRALGTSPYQEILRTRVGRAQRLLRTTEHPLGQIALEVGFYDAAQFSRHFKKVTGITPSAYRRSVAPVRSQEMKTRRGTPQ